jgi:hypothetical protein
LRPRNRDKRRDLRSPDNQGRKRDRSPDGRGEMNPYPEERRNGHQDRAREWSPRDIDRRGRVSDSPRRRDQSPQGQERRGRAPDSPRRRERSPRGRERYPRGRDRSPRENGRSPRGTEQSPRRRGRSPADRDLRDRALAAHRARNESPPPREGWGRRQASASPPQARRRVDAGASPDRGAPRTLRRYCASSVGVWGCRIDFMLSLL